MDDSVKRYNRVLDIINKRLIPDVDAKKARGEVFTPLTLVQEMILGLRRSSIEKGIPEIWGIKDDKYFDDNEEERVGGVPLSILRNSDTKWLDPANGIGNFPLVVFYILDFQIGNHGKRQFKGDENTKKRREHIIKNMLYMIELNKGNVNTTIKIFNLIFPNLKPNICCADTTKMTDEKLMNVFGVNRFDVVMGNPPYNQGGVRSNGERLFYNKFIIMGFQSLKKDGCLVFIHPPNFHRINDYNKKKIKDIFDENNLIFLRIITDSKTYFDVTVSIDYYVLQKGNKMNTSILDDNNILTEDVDISNFKIVPNFGFSIIKKLMILKEKVGNFNSEYDKPASHHSERLKKVIGKGNYPIIHLIKKEGIRVFYSKDKHKYQDKPKIIINGLGETYVFDDKDGKYGTTERPMVVLEPSRKEKIFLLSKLFQYLNLAFMLKRNISDKYVYECLPNFDKLDYNNESSMLDSLGLSDKEKKEINNYTVPSFNIKEIIEVTGTKKTIKGGKKTQKIRKT